MNKPRLMIELFAGSARMASHFFALGYETLTLDIQQNKLETIDMVCDLMKIGPSDIQDNVDNFFETYGQIVIWASPPCTYYSLANNRYYHFGPGGKPQTEEAHEANKLVLHTLDIIMAINPTYWFMENPRAFLRQQKFMNFMRETIHYCNYGENFQKPTDIWGRFPIRWNPLTRCNHKVHPGGKSKKNGSKDYFDNLPKDQRAMLPVMLCEEISMSCGLSEGAYKYESLREWL